MVAWIIDDHLLFRAGFKTLLLRLEGVQVGFEGADGSDFLVELGRPDVVMPDVVFMDISMPHIDGVQATKTALAKHPDLPIIVLSMYGEREYYTQLVDYGVRGFLLKSCDFKEVEMALKAIAAGDFYFSQELLQQMVFSRENNQTKDPDEELTEREKDVLTEVCSGLSNQEIADKLFISKRTVEKHRASIMVKTGCSNTASLVVYAVKNGLYKI